MEKCWPQLISILLLTIGVHISFTNAHQNCKPLLWHEKHFLFQSLGYDIQVCCNVSSLWAAELDSDWKLKQPTLNNVPITDLSLPGSEFVISSCEAESHIIQGYVRESRGKPCTQHMGHILRLSSTTGLKMDRWYAWCYNINVAEEGNICPQCSLQLFCSSQYSQLCNSIWIERSVVNVTNSSLAIIVKFGKDLPFPSAALRVTVEDNERQFLSVSDVESSHDINLYNITTDSVPGSERVFEVDGLSPSRWYRIKTCLIFTPPNQFLNQYNFKMSSLSPICLDQESYRTLSNHSQSLYKPFTFIALSCILLLRFVFLL